MTSQTKKRWLIGIGIALAVLLLWTMCGPSSEGAERTIPSCIPIVDEARHMARI